MKYNDPKENRSSEQSRNEEDLKTQIEPVSGEAGDVQQNTESDPSDSGIDMYREEHGDLTNDNT